MLWEGEHRERERVSRRVRGGRKACVMSICISLSTCESRDEGVTAGRVCPGCGQARDHECGNCGISISVWDVWRAVGFGAYGGWRGRER